MPSIFTGAAYARYSADTGIGLSVSPNGTTVMAVMKRSADSAGNTIFAVGGQETGATARFGFGFEGTNKLTTLTSTVVSASTLTGTVADGWMAVAVTKPTGLATPRFHKHVYSTGVTTHENGTTTQPDSSPIGPGGSIVVAKLRDGYSFTAPGSYAAVLVLSRTLTDDEFVSVASSVAAMKSMNKPSDGIGRGLWLFDGALTRVDSPFFASTLLVGGPSSVDSGGSPVGYGHQVVQAL